MNRISVRVLGLVIFIFLLASGLSARTVMISYDLVIDVPQELLGSSYIRETSIDLESGIMDKLFDTGHIVFNAPGLVITDASELENTLDQESNLARRRLTAENGGAELLIYMRMHFTGESEDDLELAVLEYEVFSVKADREQIASSRIQYARPDFIRVDGREASQILINRLSSAELF